MFFIKPSVRKQSKVLKHHLHRYLNFKRDVLTQTQRDFLEQQIDRVSQAKKAKVSRAQFEELEADITKQCEGVLPVQRTSGLADTVETVIVVAAVLLGFKTYIAQPFKIPTNSMLPTLDGVVAEYSDEKPAALQRVADAVLGGKRYVDFTAEGPLDLNLFHAAQFDPAESEQDLPAYQFSDEKVGRIQERTMRGLGLLKPIGLFNYSVLRYDDGTESGAYYLPPTRLAMLIMQTARKTGKFVLKKGDLLARGSVKTGDHVLVNKFSYHFRRPARGEVFVFTTEGLETGRSQPGTNKPLVMHYIKRLVGLPGDTIAINPPQLRLNGKEPTEFGIRRVIEADHSKGYFGYTQGRRHHRIDPDGWGYYEVPLKMPGGRPGYFAMGDNSANSSDSREIGAVPEENLVGPALLCYWPLIPHFGRIR